MARVKCGATTIDYDDDYDDTRCSYSCGCEAGGAVFGALRALDLTGRTLRQAGQVAPIRR